MLYRCGKVIIVTLSAHCKFAHFFCKIANPTRFNHNRQHFPTLALYRQPRLRGHETAIIPLPRQDKQEFPCSCSFQEISMSR